MALRVECRGPCLEAAGGCVDYLGGNARADPYLLKVDGRGKVGGGQLLSAASLHREQPT